MHRQARPEIADKEMQVTHNIDGQLDDVSIALRTNLTLPRHCPTTDLSNRSETRNAVVARSREAARTCRKRACGALRPRYEGQEESGQHDQAQEVIGHDFPGLRFTAGPHADSESVKNLSLLKFYDARSEGSDRHGIGSISLSPLATGNTNSKGVAS
jgi:hypothetical protein